MFWKIFMKTKITEKAVYKTDFIVTRFKTERETFLFAKLNTIEFGLDVLSNFAPKNDLPGTYKEREFL